MKFIPNAVTQKVGRQALVLSKNSPKLMFIGGIAAGVATVVVACRATLKLEEVLDEGVKDKADAYAVSIEAANGDEEYKKASMYIAGRTTMKIAKMYAPAVGLGIISIGLLTGSHVVLNRRIAGLSAAYAGMEKTFNLYRDKVKAELGEEKEQELYYTDSCEIDDGNGKTTVQRVRNSSTSMYSFLFDQTNKNWQRDPGYNGDFLRMQQNWANQKLNSRGYIFLSEVLEHLGLEETTESRVVGWMYGNGDNYVDFGVRDWPNARDIVEGSEGAIWLDFNVDGEIHRLLPSKKGRAND